MDEHGQGARLMDVVMAVAGAVVLGLLVGQLAGIVKEQRSIVQEQRRLAGLYGAQVATADVGTGTE